MQFQLILADNCSSCAQTRKRWNTLCDEFHVKLDVIELGSQEGQKLAKSISLKTFPALLIDGKARIVGLPGISTARKLLESELFHNIKK